jgi:hypothetical protein
LMSKTRRRSGLPKPPKFWTWQSPQACTRIPVDGVVERSAAIKAAAPRKNPKGDSRIRAYRIGSRSSSFPRSALLSNSTGSGRSGDGVQGPCELRGTVLRRAFPAAVRRLAVGPGAVIFRRRIADRRCAQIYRVDCVLRASSASRRALQTRM